MEAAAVGIGRDLDARNTCAVALQTNIPEAAFSAMEEAAHLRGVDREFAVARYKRHIEEHDDMKAMTAG
jgi:hypothetical protein